MLTVLLHGCSANNHVIACDIFTRVEGKGFKIRLKGDNKKAIKQLYEGKDLLAVHFEIYTFN